MAINDDEPDEESAATKEGPVCINRCVLGWLFHVTGERIDFEDQGDFVLVLSEDLDRLRKSLLRWKQEFARCESWALNP